MTKIIGQRIRERLDAQRLGVIKFADLIGVSRNNVYDIFLRDSINTDLLKKIGRVLNYDFFQDYLEPETIQELIIRNSISGIYVKLDLTADDIERLGLADKLLEQVKQKKTNE